MYEFGDIPRMVQNIKPERDCISSVVFSNPEGIWWMPGKYYPNSDGEYIHPIKRLISEIAGSRPGKVYIIDRICYTCEFILRTFPQFADIIVRTYDAE